MQSDNQDELNNFFTIYFILDNEQEERSNTFSYSLENINETSVGTILNNLSTRLGRSNSDSVQVDERVQRIYRNLSRLFENSRHHNNSDSVSRRDQSSYFIIFDFILNGINHSMEVERPHSSLSDTILIFESILAMRKNKLKMSKEQLKQFKKFRVTKNMLKETCSICMNKYKKREMARTLSCAHTFHIKCVDKWLLGHNNTCPVCRKKLCFTT